MDIQALSRPTEDETMSPKSLLDLPSELLQHIFEFLSPVAIAMLGQVCRRLHTESYEETIWKREICTYLHAHISRPAAIKSYRELYIAHHPHWFLLQNRVWFGDSEPSGKLIVARYDESTGSINAYTILAMKRARSWTEIDIDDSPVILHGFDPEIALDLHRPVLKLSIDSPKAEPPNEHPLGRTSTSESIYGREILMDTASDSGLYSSFMLCRTLPEVAISPGTKVWPPQRISADCRTRNASNDRFNSTGHKPRKLSEVSQNHFRLRKWVEYRRANPSLLSHQPGKHDLGSTVIDAPSFLAPRSAPNGSGVTIRMPEDITTYATLPEWCYTATPQKPWQGIWCGDYSGHGCEFILIHQPDKADEKPLPRGMDWLQRWFNSGRGGPSALTSAFASAMEEIGLPCDVLPSGSSAAPQRLASADDAEQQSGSQCCGRLEAIKLSGDVHVPRAEFTFIAPEIGDAGVLRVEDEEPFKGARVVRAAGHIADRGFQNDSYMPTQLILISHDRIAHYWEEFSSISYLHRVSLDELTNYGR